MKSGVNVNRLCGFLYLFIRLTAFWGEFRIGSFGIPKDAPNVLRIVVEHSGEFRQGVVVTLVMHVSVVTLAVPLPLGWWEIVAGVLGVAASWLVLAHPDLLLVVKMVGVLPIVLYEIALGIWLLFRGRRVQ